MKIEPNKQYKLRDGSTARVYATDGYGNYPVHGAIRCCGDDSKWNSFSWHADGTSCFEDESETPWDLVEEIKQTT